MKNNNLVMLKNVAQALGEILEKVVFVGGSTTELYADSPAAPEPRPTQDVDCIIEIATYLEYNKFGNVLRNKGFVNDTSEGAPLCRWIYRGIIVDVMPIDENILGFTNEWYPQAINHSVAYKIDDTVEVKILSVPYFFATKLSALKTRGLVDLRLSKDFEDLVFVLNNRSTVIHDIRYGPTDVTRYIRDTFSDLLSVDVFEEAISSVLDYGEPPGTKDKIVGIVENIIKTK
jgi:predicted nucleotidyltransferase